jgi:hypothetical protein
VLGVDRPKWEYLNLSADHDSVIHEIDVISAQVEVIAQIVEWLSQLGLV